MDMHAHYKAVRARLNAGPPPKVVAPPPPPEPEPEVAPEPLMPPLTHLAHTLKASELLRGLKMCPPEVKEKLLPVLEKHMVSWANVSGKSQEWKYTKCRFEVYVKLSAHGWSLSQIGRLCGDRDHTTVRSGILRFIKDKLTEGELGMCKDLGMRPVDYYDARETLRAWRGI